MGFRRHVGWNLQLYLMALYLRVCKYLALQLILRDKTRQSVVPDLINAVESSTKQRKVLFT